MINTSSAEIQQDRREQGSSRVRPTEQSGAFPAHTSQVLSRHRKSVTPRGSGDTSSTSGPGTAFDRAHALVASRGRLPQRTLALLRRGKSIQASPRHSDGSSPAARPKHERKARSHLMKRKRSGQLSSRQRAKSPHRWEKKKKRSSRCSTKQSRISTTTVAESTKIRRSGAIRLRIQ